VECPLHLENIRLPARGTALLEDLGNLTANELYDPAGAGENAASAILEGLDQLAGQCAHLIVVSNEVFSGGADYAGDTGRYLKALAQVQDGAARLVVAEQVGVGQRLHAEAGQGHCGLQHKARLQGPAPGRKDGMRMRQKNVHANLRAWCADSRGLCALCAVCKGHFRRAAEARELQRGKTAGGRQLTYLV
jgi:hypothetical protein